MYLFSFQVPFCNKCNNKFLWITIIDNYLNKQELEQQLIFNDHCSRYHNGGAALFRRRNRHGDRYYRLPRQLARAMEQSV